ncbi:uncharacterized protein LOC134692188 [Mytilus trossulus]
MNKDCRKCKNKNVKKHKCQRNHAGSSKSMEAAAAVTMFKRSEEKGLRYTTLIGDDDSTTLFHVRKNLKYQITKWSDIQHTKRSLYGQLLNLKKKNNQCTDMVVAYFKRLFTHALYQNKDKPEQLGSTFRSIPMHAFGDHIQCGNWCKYSIHPTTYRHTGLPRGKPLTDNLLKDKLTSLFDVYANNADRLSPLASSQKNDSINSVIAKKAPKSMHFGGSRSLNYRVSAAVSQINNGRKYTTEVLQRLNVTIGSNTAKYVCHIDRKRKLDAARKTTIPFKRKRSILKSDRCCKQLTNEVREGPTYQTSIIMNNNNTEEDQIEELPIAEIRPELESFRTQNDSSIIIFDLETTGLGKHLDLLILYFRTGMITDYISKHENDVKFVLHSDDTCKKLQKDIHICNTIQTKMQIDTEYK